MIASGLMSSACDCWETPKELFAQLDLEFGFQLDAAASSENAKCASYYTESQDALSQDWKGVVFCNPPYGRKLPLFVSKAYCEARKWNGCVVLLIPARTDTRYWHEVIFPNATDIRFIKGRVRFEMRGVAKDAAPFPSAVVVFDYRED